MKKISKIICMAVAMVLSLSVLKVNTYATYEYSVTKSNTFQYSWEKVITFYDQGKNKIRGTMRYGYNTFMIDEDYCKLDAALVECMSSVVNDRGIKYSRRVPTTKTATCEQWHKGNVVEYHAYFYTNDVYVPVSQ